MSKALPPPTPYKAEPTDLRNITRNARTCLTTVVIYPPEFGGPDLWLSFGEATMRHFSHKNTWELKGRLKGYATDDEHDTGYALCLPLIGLSFRETNYQQSDFSAWVDPNNFEGFRVPRPGYNPMKMKGHRKCSGDCKIREPHIIVPSGFWAGPPPDRELFRDVRGRRVDISIGPILK